MLSCYMCQLTAQVEAAALTDRGKESIRGITQLVQHSTEESTLRYPHSNSFDSQPDMRAMSNPVSSQLHQCLR